MFVARVLSVLLVLAGAATARAVVVDIRMDFGTAAASPGDNWNTIAGNKDADVIDVPLKDYQSGLTTNITASLIRLRNTYFWGEAVTNAWNPANPGPSWLDGNKYAAMDYVKQGWNSYGELRFKGLDPSIIYTIEVISSRSNAEDKNVPWQVFAATTSAKTNFNARTQGYQQGLWLTWTDVIPNANGEIAVRVGVDGATSYSQYLNAARLYAVPEPASLALIALGGLLAVRRRA